MSDEPVLPAVLPNARLQARITELEAKLAAIDARHRLDGWSMRARRPDCICGQVHPCPDRRILDGRDDDE